MPLRKTKTVGKWWEQKKTRRKTAAQSVGVEEGVIKGLRGGGSSPGEGAGRPALSCTPYARIAIEAGVEFLSRTLATSERPQPKPLERWSP